jgi:hypothetical protein
MGGDSGITPDLALKAVTPANSLYPSVSMDEDEVFTTMWFLPDNIDLKHVIEFYLYFGLENPGAGEIVSWDLRYALHTLGEGGTNITDPATTTGLTQMTDLTIAGATAGDVRVYKQGPSTIAASTFTAGTDEGKALGMSFDLDAAVSTITGLVHLFGIKARYRRIWN